MNATTIGLGMPPFITSRQAYSAKPVGFFFSRTPPRLSQTNKRPLTSETKSKGEAALIGAPAMSIEANERGTPRSTSPPVSPPPPPPQIPHLRSSSPFLPFPTLASHTPSTTSHGLTCPLTRYRFSGPICNPAVQDSLVAEPSTNPLEWIAPRPNCKFCVGQLRTLVEYYLSPLGQLE